MFQAAPQPVIIPRSPEDSRQVPAGHVEQFHRTHGLPAPVLLDQSEQPSDHEFRVPGTDLLRQCRQKAVERQEKRVDPLQVQRMQGSHQAEAHRVSRGRVEDTGNLYA
jgi:hypothetical protein